MFQFLCQLDAQLDELLDDKEGEMKKKRMRRKAHMIDRNFKCGYPGCVKAYGSQVCDFILVLMIKAALKFHVKTKHADDIVPADRFLTDMISPMVPPGMMFVPHVWGFFF